MGSRKLSTALLALLLTSIPPGFAKEAFEDVLVDAAVWLLEESQIATESPRVV